MAKIAAGAGLVACALLASLLVDSVAAHRRPVGVIVAEEVAARKGDGEIYETAFSTPLHAGTEIVLREDRGGWYFVEIPDGRTCWIPARSVEMVEARDAD